MPRPVAKLVNRQNGKAVVCQVLKIDKNFRDKYNGAANTLTLAERSPVAVINQWYRDCLGLQKGDTAELQIKPICGCLQWFAQLRAAFSHPDHNARLAADLVIVSLLLGSVGLVLGMISLLKCP